MQKRERRSFSGRVHDGDGSGQGVVERPIEKQAEKVVKKASVGGKTKAKPMTMKEKWAPTREKLGHSSATFLRETLDEAAKEFGDPDICTAGEAGRLVIGVPLPAFSMEYLVQNTVWPLGKVMQVVGPEGACKTGFGFEVARWFIEYCYGLGQLFEHESKYSPDWAMSIIGWQYPDSFGHIPCDAIDAWQKRLQWFIKKVKQQMLGTQKKRGPGMIYPVHAMIDSIMGKSMLITQKKIEAEGVAGPHHPVEAGSITDYFKKVPQDIRRWPISILAINHLKMKPDPVTGHMTVRGKAGGAHVSFQETFELEMRKAGKTKGFADFDLIPLRIKCEKNSLGITGRMIPVDVLFWDEPVDKDDPNTLYRQKTVWNWHASSVRLLIGECLGSSDEEKARMLKRVASVLDLHKLEKAQRVWSKVLGIPEKGALPYHEAGKVLFENDKIMSALRHVFGIKERAAFQPGISYRKQIDDERRKIATKLR